MNIFSSDNTFYVRSGVVNQASINTRRQRRFYEFVMLCLLQREIPLKIVGLGQNIKVGETTEVHVMSAIRRGDYPVPGRLNVILLTWAGKRRKTPVASSAASLPLHALTISCRFQPSYSSLIQKTST